ncbi:MAG: DUF4091 domain-containing protein [Phycisphaerae bacterium]|nr:DUF4091 domain-containing protein [Phycisphaerae bacterium]
MPRTALNLIPRFPRMPLPPFQSQRLAAALLPVLILVLPGCRTGPHLEAETPVVRLAAGIDLDSLSRTVLLSNHAAIGETISFVVAVEIERGALVTPSLRSEALCYGGERIPTSALSIYRLQGVRAGPNPGWYLRAFGAPPGDREILDVLVPIEAPVDGMPERMLPGHQYAFWIDLAVPRGTPAGNYTGNLSVVSSGKSVAELGLEVEVWPFVLPDANEVTLLGGVDHRALVATHIQWKGRPVQLRADPAADHAQMPRIRTLLDRTGALLRSHRVEPTLDFLQPQVRVGGDGRPRLDWSGYDTFAQSLWSASTPPPSDDIPWLALPNDVERFSPSVTREAQSERWRRAFVDECRDHFSSQGWLEQAHAELSDSADHDPRRTREVEQLRLDAFRGADCPMPVLSHLFTQNLAYAGWPGNGVFVPGDGVTIWSPRAQFFDPAAMSAEREAGRRTWFCLDRPPYSGSTALSAPAAFQRVVPWQGLALGAELIELGQVFAPPTENTADSRATLSPGGFPLVYPGTPYGLDAPIPSVRLKYLRRGQQDLALLALLRENGLSHVGEALQDALVAYAGTGAARAYYADPKPVGWAMRNGPFEDARLVACRMLAQRARGGTQPALERDLATDAAWRRLMSESRAVILHVDGVRFRSRGDWREGLLEANVSMLLTNRSRVPVSGMAKFAVFPPGWSAADAARPVTDLPPNRSARVQLTALVDLARLMEWRGRPITVEFQDGNGEKTLETATPSMVMPLSVSSPITIDGDLSDWPPGDINVMRGFSLVASGGAFEAMTPDRGARFDTTVFLMRDEESLYVGVNCMTSGTEMNQAADTNQITYDDLIPVGEELVEILIDPLNAGTRTPDDLFHFAIKSSGAVLVERGVTTNPPITAPSSWSAKVRGATRKEPPRWTAELRIPLSAFGSPAVRTIWGINVTRMHGAAEEFSSWAPASGNAYDPLTLGNMLLP